MLITITLGIILAAIIIKWWREALSLTFFFVGLAIQCGVIAGITGWFFGAECAVIAGALAAVANIVFLVAYSIYSRKSFCRDYGVTSEQLRLVRRAAKKFARSARSYTEERLLRDELFGFGLRSDAVDYIIEMSRD